jgi:hypothetical protein
MIRNLKALGLALVAVFALSAMGASAASAQKNGVITSSSNYWLHGADEIETNPKLTAFGGTTACDATYTGGKLNATNKVTGHHEALASGASIVTISPHYTNCKGNGVLPETVTMNGCDYVLRIGETIGVDLYSVTADLVCPAGKEVTIDIYLNAESHAVHPLVPDCTIHIPGQVGLGGATLLDETNGKLTLGGTVKKIKSTRTAGPCGALSTEEGGELHLEATLEGRSAATGGGVNTPLSITHK